MWGAFWLLVCCGKVCRARWAGGMEDEMCVIIAQGEGRGGIYRAARECVVTSAVGPQSAKAGKLRKKDEIVFICSAQFDGVMS